jgi:hypothetical protein
VWSAVIEMVDGNDVAKRYALVTLARRFGGHGLEVM